MNIHKLIQVVRDQLETADEQRRLAGKSPLFHLEKLEFEIRFVATETKAVTGGLDLKVLTFDKDSRREVEAAHVVRITYAMAAEASEPPPGARAHSSTIGPKPIDIPLIQ
jgi:Trypsin-co-occurring domain 2